MNVVLDLSQYVDPKLIDPDLKVDNRDDAIRHLIGLIFKQKPDFFSGTMTPDALTRLVLERESIQTTGLGNTIALPHTRIDDCEDMAVAIGIHREGVDWQSLDGRPCRVVVLTISTSRKPYLILQMTAAIVRFLKDPTNLNRIVATQSPEKVARILTGTTLETEHTVLANDLMKPVLESVRLDTPLEQATRLMHLRHVDVLPVVDESNVLRGELSCMDIFTYGTPDFFRKLRTISFMRNLDPFERYFKYQKQLKVSDVCTKPTNIISKEATLMEVIFEVSVKNRVRLFVVDEGRLIGTIDRFSIIDKVLFF